MTSRQPQGIPVGGQFAADRKGEPTTSLVSGGGQFGVPAEDDAPKPLTVGNVGNLDEDARTRLELDAEALAKEGLRGRIRSAVHGSYKDGVDGLLWTSPAGNKITIHGLDMDERSIADARETFNSGAIRLPAMEDYDPDDHRTGSLVRLAQDMDRKLNIARAWEETKGFSPQVSTRVKAVNIDVNGDMQFSGQTSAGTVFDLRHSTNNSETKGFLITRDGLRETKMDADDLGMYMSRLVGRRLDGSGGETPQAVMNRLCKDLRWNFRNLNDDK